MGPKVEAAEETEQGNTDAGCLECHAYDSETDDDQAPYGSAAQQARRSARQGCWSQQKVMLVLDLCSDTGFVTDAR